MQSHSNIQRQQSYSIRFRAFVQEIAEKYDTDKNTKKRTYENSFGVREYDIERYGQEIVDDFFRKNVGHAVIG
jgi:hypothetical protein